MTNSTSLHGRRILITGATGVLGRELARQLASAGADLILLARRKARLEEVDDEIAGLGAASPLLVELDFLRASPGHYRELAQALTADGLDALVLCSGLHTGLHPLEHLPGKDWQQILDVTLNGPFQLIQALLPLLQAREGQLIGVSDRPGEEQKAFWGAYAVAKAGLDALLHICAEENENRLRVDRVIPEPQPSPIRAAVYPGEVPAQLSSPAENARRIVHLLEQPRTGVTDA